MRSVAITLLLGVAGVAAWQAAPAFQNEAEPAPVVENSAAPAVVPEVAPARPRQSVPPKVAAVTPMGQRVGVLGVLNKRNGVSRDISLRPGQAVRLGDLIVRLRACERTADWEPQKLTGAFVQADVRGRDDKWRRIFSGWLFKESPSLNVVEHPIYDVWPKSCEMRYPEIGPETLVAPSPEASANRSSAKKSADAPIIAPPPPLAAPPTPSASSSNPT
jgi:hypothetical protein